jgi:hypothetical protein
MIPNKGGGAILRPSSFATIQPTAFNEEFLAESFTAESLQTGMTEKRTIRESSKMILLS